MVSESGPQSFIEVEQLRRLEVCLVNREQAIQIKILRKILNKKMDSHGFEKTQ